MTDTEQKAPRTFFTSDTHFGHKRIIELCNRPFRDVAHMDTEMIARWNAVVEPQDVVYHLGDACMGNLEASLYCVKQLNGYKILVPGNHDRIFSGTTDKYKQERFRPMYESVFDDIAPESFQLTIGGYDVNVSHFPYDGDSHGENRWMDKRLPDDGKVIIHGHVHEEFVTRGKQINVGVDVWNFTPVREDLLIKVIDQVLVDA